MPILKCKTHIEVYEHRAHAKDSHELSGRGNKKYLTKFISHNILNEVKPKKIDKIVDGKSPYRMPLSLHRRKSKSRGREMPVLKSKLASRWRYDN